MRIPLALVLLVHCIAAALPGQSSGDRDMVRALQPGDVMRIEVWGQPELSGEFRIAADGSVAHPLYRRLQVAGRDLDELERDVDAFLRQFQATPQFVIEPLFTVRIGGEVRQPRLYPLGPGTTIAHAIWLAGGPTDTGRLDRVRLRRAGTEQVLDLTNPARDADAIRIRSGDEIIVDRRRNVLRDYVAPTASIVGAAASIMRLFRVFGR